MITKIFDYTPIIMVILAIAIMAVPWIGTLIYTVRVMPQRGNPFQNLSQASSSGGRFQSRPFPARTAKIMESAGHLTKQERLIPAAEEKEHGSTGRICNRHAHQLGRLLGVNQIR